MTWSGTPDRVEIRLSLFQANHLGSGCLPAFLEVPLLHTQTQAFFVPFNGTSCSSMAKQSVQKESLPAAANMNINNFHHPCVAGTIVIPRRHRGPEKGICRPETTELRGVRDRTQAQWSGSLGLCHCFLYSRHSPTPSLQSARPPRVPGQVVPFPLGSLRLDFTIMAFRLMEGVPLHKGVVCASGVLTSCSGKSPGPLCFPVPHPVTQLTVTAHTLKDLPRGRALC